MPKSNQSNPNPQMFSNLQMNQNINNKSNTNPYLRGQNLPNNPPSINPTVAGHQPQLSSGSQKLQNNSRQPPSFSLSNKINNNPLNPAQNNFNQSLAPHSHFIQNLPTPSQNGFLGPQNVINPVLINLPTTQNQSINPINIQTLSNPTEKMSP